jgi:hypothetical protein
MRLQVKGKNVEVSRPCASTPSEKLASWASSSLEPTQVESSLRAEEPSIAQPRPGNDLHEGRRCEREASPDMKVSIDQLSSSSSWVKRYRERRIVEPRRHTAHNGDVA